MDGRRTAAQKRQISRIAERDRSPSSMMVVALVVAPS